MYLSERGRCLGHCVCLIRCETSTCCFRLTMCDEVLMLLSHECCELWTKITWKYSSHFLFVLYFTELYVFLQWFSLSASSPSHSVKVNIEDSKCFIRGEKDASKESNKDRRSDRQRRRRAELNICADLRADATFSWGFCSVLLGWQRSSSPSVTAAAPHMWILIMSSDPEPSQRRPWDHPDQHPTLTPHSRTNSFSKTDPVFHKPRRVCRLSFILPARSLSVCGCLLYQATRQKDHYCPLRESSAARLSQVIGF